MTVLVATRGLPASGKTTWARKWVAEAPTERHRVNKDDFRYMLNAGYFEKGITEKLMLDARDAAVSALLKDGIDVVCDDTNLPSDSLKRLVKLAETAGTDFEVEDFTDVSLDICLERNKVRAEHIDDDVITVMHDKFLKGKDLPLPIPAKKERSWPKPYTSPRGATLAFLCDIDGTIAKMNGRSPYDETRVIEDLPNTAVILLVHALIHKGYLPVFMSGRTRYCEDTTRLWIYQKLGLQAGAFKLFMREVGDKRKDSEVKLELFNTYVRYNYDIELALDDRDQVVKLWRDLGITCLQVDEGNF